MTLSGYVYLCLFSAWAVRKGIDSKQCIEKKREAPGIGCEPWGKGEQGLA